MYGLYGQLINAGLQYEAGDREKTRQQELAGYQNDARRQQDDWQMQSNQAMQDYLRNATAKRFASQRTLADQLGSSARNQAGAAAGQQSDLDTSRALAMLKLQPAGDRTSPAFGTWQGATQDRYAPVMDARRALINQAQAQRGMANYDTDALNTAQDTSIDINRQADEQQRMANLLQLYRQQILAQNQAQHHDTGPTQGYYNMQALGSLAAAGGAAADSYQATNKQNSGKKTYDV